MNDNQRKEIALFRYGIIAPLITDSDGNASSRKEFFRNAAKQIYINPRGESTRISSGTIERWYYSYIRDGFDALIPKRRCDTGMPRKMDDDIQQQIIYLKNEYPRIPATLIHQKLIDNGTINEGDLSLSSVTRYVNSINHELKLSNNKDMRRYEMAHINEVWCGDTTYGPYLNISGCKKRVYIIALIDDASRFIVGIDIFFNDTFVNLMSVIKSAVIKFGKPKIFNFDNGASFKNKQMELLAARIGSVIHYNRPHTPTGKAKIERWFRTLKDNWMSSLNMKNFSSLDELRVSLLRFVNEYNQKVHSSLNGLSPQDRYFKEAYMIKRLTDKQLETAFLLEYERRVSADCVINIDSTEYEVDYHYAKQKVLIRYSPDLSNIYVIDRKTGEATPLKLLNKIDNSQIKRTKVKLTGGNE